MFILKNVFSLWWNFRTWSKPSYKNFTMYAIFYSCILAAVSLSSPRHVCCTETCFSCGACNVLSFPKSHNCFATRTQVYLLLGFCIIKTGDVRAWDKKQSIVDQHHCCHFPIHLGGMKGMSPNGALTASCEGHFFFQSGSWSWLDSPSRRLQIMA